MVSGVGGDVPKGAVIAAKYVYVRCSCGQHAVDLFDTVWNDSKIGYYECNACLRPLVVRGSDGEFYVVGEKI